MGSEAVTALALLYGQHELLNQARRCRAMGSAFVACVLEAADRQILRAPITSAMVIGWPGDPAAAALALRINGALHALARRGSPPSLAALYRREHDDFDGAIGAAFAENDGFIADWIRHPTQTNEVARSAATMAALMAAPLSRPMPYDLLELGASCGLNLNLDRYDFALGSVSTGDPWSAVRIAPQWRGSDPIFSPVKIASARGVDLNPLNASDPGDRERLLSFAWADQPARSKRLEEALRIAADYPPRIDRDDAVRWLAQRLDAPQAIGHCRAVVHTMFLQYLRPHDQDAIGEMIAAAGERATHDRPLIWVGFEWTSDRREVELRLTCWPLGESVVLASCHPYGEWIAWKDTAANASPHDQASQAEAEWRPAIAV